MAELIELYCYYANMADEYKTNTEYPESFRKYKVAMFTVLAHIVEREIEVVYA